MKTDVGRQIDHGRGGRDRDALLGGTDDGRGREIDRERLFGNPDHVSIVIHNYRWRLGVVDGETKYDDLERQLEAGPVITVPTITLEGDANGAPYLDSSSYAKKFSGKYSRRTIKGDVGHNLPQDSRRRLRKQSWTWTRASLPKNHSPESIRRSPTGCFLAARSTVYGPVSLKVRKIAPPWSLFSKEILPRVGIARNSVFPAK
jgi:hypothetical protein